MLNLKGMVTRGLFNLLFKIKQTTFILVLIPEKGQGFGPPAPPVVPPDADKEPSVHIQQPRTEWREKVGECAAAQKAITN